MDFFQGFWVPGHWSAACISWKTSCSWVVVPPSPGEAATAVRPVAALSLDG
jgi:hypothetical protein